MNPFHFITEQAARDIMGSHSPRHISAVDSRRPAQERHRLAHIVAKAALLAVVLLPLLGSPVLAASDMFAPVGGSGFTAVLVEDGVPSFVSVDEISARRLRARGVDVAETVVFSVPSTSQVVSTQNVPPIPSVVFAAPSGPLVAVIDTGLDVSHSWFSGEFAGHVVPGRSVVGDPADWSDANGHGTHVAGVVRLVDPSARILPVRVFDASGFGTDRAVADGIVWAVENGARVVNLSLGGPARSLATERAVDFARSRDVVVVAAAGNDAERGSPVMYPAAFESVVAVAAHDAFSPAFFSNRGAYVDVSAEGMSVWSAHLSNRVVLMGGTSAASPFVAAAAARVRAARPDLDAATVKSLLESSAVDIGEPGRDDVFGWGAVDVGRALAASAELVVPPSPESAGQLKVRTTSRVGAIVLHIDSPTSSLEVYAGGKLLDVRTDTRARVVVPALYDTTLKIVANDLEGRAYETLTTTASPLPVAEPAVSLERSRQSVKVTAVLPKVDGRVYLHAKSSDGELLVIWLEREGKARLVSHQFASSRRISWTVTVCLVAADLESTDLVCGVATTNR